jgi:hypothetical protein
MGLRPRKTEEEEEAPAKGEGCDIVGCGKPVKRHLALGKVTAALPNEKVRPGTRSVALCHDHYRDFKKATRNDRDLERAGW